MTVNVEEARTKGLATTYEGREYVFCGKGCFLEFGDDPETFLAVGFTRRCIGRPHAHLRSRPGVSSAVPGRTGTSEIAQFASFSGRAPGIQVAA